MSEFEDKILQMVQDGVLTSAEGARLLETLEASREGAASGEVAAVVSAVSLEPEASEPAEPPDMAWFRSFWLLPFVIAAAVLLLTGWGLWAAFQAPSGWANFFGLLCLGPLFSLAFLGLILAFWSRFAYWLHVRVREKKGRRIAISLPLPMILIKLVLRFAGRYVGEKQAANLSTASELLSALDEQGDPLFISVDDDDGDQVQVYIG